MILNIKPATKTQIKEINELMNRCHDAFYDEDSILELMRGSLLAATVVCDKTVRGFCVCESTPIPDGCEITALYIDDEYRGIGLGRKLLSFALREMRARHIRAAFLWVDEKNTRAASFFERIGFEADGKQRHNIGADDVYEKRYRIDI